MCAASFLPPPCFPRDAFPHADVASESFGCLLASCVTQRQLLQNEVGGDAAGFLSAAGQMKKQSLGLERVRRVGGWPGVLAKRYRSEAAWNGHRVRIGCVVDTSAAIIPPRVIAVREATRSSTTYLSIILLSKSFFTIIIIWNILFCCCNDALSSFI